MATWITVVGLLVVFLVWRWKDMRDRKASVQNLPGPNALFPYLGLLNALLPMKYLPKGNWFILQGETWIKRKHWLFDLHDSSVIAHHVFLPLNIIGRVERPLLFVADVDAINMICETSRTNPFAKPLYMYRAVSTFGRNVLITEGVEWRKHRKIVSNGFSEKNNALVWQESVRVSEAWMASLEARADTDGTVVDANVREGTMKMALMILSSAAFGIEFPWNEDSDESKVSLDPNEVIRKQFRTTLGQYLRYLNYYVLIPNWALKKHRLLSSIPLSPFKGLGRMASTRESYLKQLQTMIDSKKRELESSDFAPEKADRQELFSLLVAASHKAKYEDEDGFTDAKLTDGELISNMFIFFLAGHETTAHTLAFAFAFLALNPEVQEKLHQESMQFGEDHISTYDDYSQVPYALGVFLETLRLVPAVPNIPKITSAPVDLPYHVLSTGERKQVHLPAGVRVNLCVAAMHADGRVWPEPDKFKPERFIDTKDYKWNRGAFLPFSGGLRSCIGSKFAEVEGACVLHKIARYYKIEVREEDEFEFTGDPQSPTRRKRSQEEIAERVLRNRPGITTTPVDLGLKFKKRA